MWDWRLTLFHMVFSVAHKTKWDQFCYWSDIFMGEACGARKSVALPCVRYANPQVLTHPDWRLVIEGWLIHTELKMTTSHTQVALATDSLYYVIEIAFVEMNKKSLQDCKIHLSVQTEDELSPKECELDIQSVFFIKDLKETLEFLRFCQGLNVLNEGIELVMKYSEFDALKLELSKRQELKDFSDLWKSLQN